MLATALEWVSLATFVVMIATILYNRAMAVRKMEAKVDKLEAQFQQYQRDFAHYLEVCELCRGEVRRHHEDEQDRHVTTDMRQQIQTLVDDVGEIKNFLMQNPRVS